MELPFDISTVNLFIVLILPGLISMQVYRMMMPSRALDWGTAALEGLFYGILNLILSLPILLPLHHYNVQATHPKIYLALLGTVLLILPAIWPAILIWLHKTKRFTKWLQMPHPTAWDYFFDQRPEVFVLIHLKTGEMVGGYYGANSYASAFPHEGDIYVELVYKVNEHGQFGPVMKDSRGLLVRHDEYTHVELFNLPKGEEKTNDKESE